jgi:hypothetical protein
MWNNSGNNDLMAARLNPRHSELVLKRIRIRQLCNRLELNALGELKNPQGDPIQMTDGQIRSATFLIERTVAKAEAPKDLNLNGNLTVSIKRYGA